MPVRTVHPSPTSAPANLRGPSYYPIIGSPS
jgi:hypothetical protein